MFEIISILSNLVSMDSIDLNPFCGIIHDRNINAAINIRLLHFDMEIIYLEIPG